MVMPKKPAHLAHKSHTIVHVRQSEHEAVGRLARHQSLTVSAYMRQLLLVAVDRRHA
jgi:hypothetical protein